MRRWAAWRCRKNGITVHRAENAVEFVKDGITLRLSPKHMFFARAVCRSFESFARALPAKKEGNTSLVDFTADPAAFTMARRCRRFGVAVEKKDDSVWLRKGNKVMMLAPSHFVYSEDLAQRFDLYFSPLVPEQRDGLLVLNYSRPGMLQQYAKSGLKFEMASFPEEDEAVEEYFRWYRPQRGDLVFDMGAHCGVSAYHLSQLVGPEGRVIAFEPDPTNYALLLRNISRHNLANVVPQNVAIAGTSGKLPFNAEGTVGSSLGSLLRRESVGSRVMVDAITLEDAFEKWGAPAFCKIDIEGAEIEVLETSAKILHRCRTNFALDTNHPRANGKTTDKEVEAMFRASGFEVASEARPFLTTWARPK